jgi:crotonobetainyl-CoA:carnitine CoA-transferase CaiB-like acyl-CoA transferase
MGAQTTGEPDYSRGPLAGVRVVDLSHFAAGPVATMVLADLGADVIKVEHPRGDPCRDLGVTFPGGWSTFFLALNRNKRFVSIDYKTEAGQSLIRDLVSEADVFVENARPGAWDGYGLDYSSLKALNPQLIYASISGFGRSGPMADWLGMDPIAQAAGGLMGITGSPASGPVKVGAAVADVVSGRLLAFGIMTALYDRIRTGKGQLVETSLFATTVSMLSIRETEFQFTGENPALLGTAHGQIVPAQAFGTSDGRHVMLCCYGDEHFRRWATIAGHAEIVDDPRFATASARSRNAEAVLDAIQVIMLERTEDEWTQLLAGRVPYGPILQFDQLWDHPQMEAQQLMLSFQMAGVGDVRTVGSPVQWSAFSPMVRHAPDVIGANTAEILTEHGVSTARIRELSDSGVIVCGANPRATAGTDGQADGAQ